MKNILFIHHTLQLGGGEKYIKELVDFSIDNGLKPTIIIPNNLKEEYYDNHFKSKGVKVIRFTVLDKVQIIRHFYSKNAYWNIVVRFGLGRRYEMIHFVNLGIASRYYDLFKHSKRKFWHVGNSIQYPERNLPFNEDIFGDSSNELICINVHQINELKKKFKLQCKVTLFKLFLND